MTTATHAPHPTGSSVHVHIMPIPVLIGIWAALMFFTVFTVAMSYVNLGMADLVLVMVIATIKASLVGLYFMHLRYDKPFNSVVFLSSLGFLGFFIIVALMDTAAYRPFIQPDLLPDYRTQPNPPATSSAH